MKAAIYARFSTENQREASIEDQIRICCRVASAAGIEVVECFDDRGISGGTAERPGYQALLAAARSGRIQLIVSEDISRLWRSRAEYGTRSAELEDLGVHLLTAVGDDTRRDGYGLVLGIKQAIAEHARREISYRTRRGLEGRALAGASTGGTCYGYQGGKIDPETAGVVLWAFRWAADGSSANQIAGRLNQGDFPAAPRGGTWRPSTVVAILKNQRYLGAVIWGRTEGRASAADSRRKSRRTLAQALVQREDAALRIVDPDLFKRAQVALANRTCRPVRAVAG